MNSAAPAELPPLAPELQRALLEEISDGVFVLDDAGRFLEANHRGAALLGLSREELLRLNVQDIAAPEELPELAPLWHRLLAGGHLVREWRLRHRDGRTLTIELGTAPMDGGRIFAVARDLSSHRQAEESLRAAEERIRLQHRVLMHQARSQALGAGELPLAFQEITEAAALGLDLERTSIWLFTEDRLRLRCADLFERAAGRHSGGQELDAAKHPAYFQALGKNRTVATSDALSDPRTSELASSYLAPLGIHSLLDAPVRLNDQVAGVICHEHVGPRREWTLDEQSFAGSLADFVALALAAAQRKRAAEERAAIERRLQETQKLESLGVLAGGIAHDFNNLLTGILGNASLARMVAPPAAESRKFIEKIETASLRAADLCKEMLAYSGRGHFQMQRVDLSALVEETTHLLQLSISKNTVPKFNLAHALPAVQADPTQMRQIVMNLVMNASDAIGDRSGVVAVSTGVMRADRDYLATTYLSPDLPEGDYVFLEVSDTGCGMSTETLTKIFDPFFTTKVNGRGLGLAAVLGIVRAHKGAFKVTSQVGRGSTFKLLLPCAEGPGEQFAAVIASVADWRGSGTVLVVDDEETVRAVTARMLEAFGFEVLLANDGRAGLAVFQQHSARIVAVMLDLNMPHMGGARAFQELRRLQPDLRVLLMSGFNEEEVMESFIDQGLGGFLQKPFTPELLRERMRMILAKGRE